MPKPKNKRKYVGLAIVCVLLLGASAILWVWYKQFAREQAQQLAGAAQRSMSDFFSIFADQGLIPIVRPGAQEVGGVYNAKTRRWVYEAATCFPNLKAQAAVPSALPEVILKHAEDTSVALGFDKMVSALVGVNLVRSAKMTFSEVTVQDTPEYSFRETYSAQKCPELSAIIASVTSGQQPTVPVEPLFILGTLYRAKRTVTIELVNGASAAEALGAITRAIPVKGHIQSRESGNASITLENDIVLPVAAMPAFIPTPTGVTLGSGQPSTRIVWLPFDPSLNPDAIDLFKRQFEYSTR